MYQSRTIYKFTMVSCWVDINLSPSQVQDFSVLGKCSRQRACINMTSRPNWYNWRKAELVSKVNTGELPWTLSKAKKSWTKPGQRLMLTRCLGLPWHFHSWLHHISDHGRCHVSKLLLMAPCHDQQLWYMARIGIYFISRMPLEKIRTGNLSRQERKCNGKPRKYSVLILEIILKPQAMRVNKSNRLLQVNFSRKI